MAQSTCPCGLRAALVVVHWYLTIAFLEMKKKNAASLDPSEANSSETGTGEMERTGILRLPLVCRKIQLSGRAHTRGLRTSTGAKYPTVGRLGVRLSP